VPEHPWPQAGSDGSNASGRDANSQGIDFSCLEINSTGKIERKQTPVRTVIGGEALQQVSHGATPATLAGSSAGSAAWPVVDVLRPFGTIIGEPVTGSGMTMAGNPKTSSTSCPVTIADGLSATMAPSFMAMKCDA
jgi:hypothetical protein